MNLNHIFILLLFVLLSSCHKDPPVAYFTTGKYEDIYTGGDTIHLTDASTNAYHWRWVFSDGTVSKERNPDYIIPINEKGPLGFILLEAASKTRTKTSKYSKTIKIYQASLPSDYFCCDVGCKTSLPDHKNASAEGTNWIISAWKNTQFCYYNSVSIFFPGNNRPTVSGTYLLKDKYTSLLSNEACVKMNYGQCDDPIFYTSTSGELIVTVIGGGAINVVFNAIPANRFYQRTTTPTVISGNITYY